MAKEGRLFVFFPEGTFTRRAGLLGFYMGAFKVAADAGLPVVPGILRGVRTLLRGDQWFPRRTRDQRRDRGADPAVRHRLHRDAGAARCRTRRDAEARRRAGSRRAWRSRRRRRKVDNFSLFISILRVHGVLSGWLRGTCCAGRRPQLLYGICDGAGMTAGGNHGLDHPDPRRNLHRPRDQRLSAGRILTLDFLVLGPRPA